jgi:hypothetical protein
MGNEAVVFRRSRLNVQESPFLEGTPIRLAGNLVFDKMIQIAAMAGVPGLK